MTTPLLHPPISLRTVGQFIEHRHSFWICCAEPGCGHSHLAVMEQVARALGPDFDLYDASRPLAEALRVTCPKCGGKRWEPRVTSLRAVPGQG